MISSLSSCDAFCRFFPLIPSQDPGIFGHTGKGATLLGQLLNVATTGVDKIDGLFHQSARQGKFAQIIEKPGQNLFSNICKRFFHRIVKEKKELNLFDCFYTSEHSVTDFTLRDLKRFLNDEIMEKEHDLNTGLFCIPIVVGRNALFEARHMVVIQIMKNTVYYYDSQGIASEQRKLQDGSTLRNFIEMIQEILTDGSGGIVENGTIHQWDIYNCAAYVSHYVFQTMILGKTHAELERAELPHSYIQQFRQAMAKDLDI